MPAKKIIFLAFFFSLLTVMPVFAESAKDADINKNYNDFLHYMMIGRLNLAKSYAKALLDSNPDSVELFKISQQSQSGMLLLQKARDNEYDAELAELSGQVLNMVNKGRFIQRHDPKVLVEEVKRLSTTPRGFMTAVQRLQNAGEYSVMYMIDALQDPARKEEWPNVIDALPRIGRDSIRPLAAALQTENIGIRTEIIKALGDIQYPQSLAYLKYVIENEESAQLRGYARESIRKIDPSALNVPAAMLFYSLAENYYYHAQSLQPVLEGEFANIWFWDTENKQLIKSEVDRKYFNELMAMRCCEWSLKADPSFGQAIGLWLAAFFKAEGTGIAMPEYFGGAHPDSMTYATTAGPEYLHQALARALKDNNAYVALASIEALAKIAGEKSLMYRLGIAQPLLQALNFNDRSVRYSAAVAIATAGPVRNFNESKLVTRNLAEALGQNPVKNPVTDPNWSQQISDSYAVRAAMAIIRLGETRNTVVDLSPAQNDLINATKDRRENMRVLAGRALAYLPGPDAQRAIAAMALERTNTMPVRIEAFNSLAVSGKINANQLDNSAIDAVYKLLSSSETDPQLRAAAATAFGALNLPSRKVKDLILDQAKI